MTTTTTRAVRNFVAGGHVDAASGQTAELVNPATGEVYATAPISGQEDVEGALTVARRAFESWRETTPGERQLALFRFADSIEARADELLALECENTGKPLELTRQEELPMLLDQLRFFAGAARVLEGKSAGEYMSGHT
ncbi:MAG: aldehyde dehydrogenase family protein, partial [Haloechinothrix sp.]